MITEKVKNQLDRLLKVIADLQQSYSILFNEQSKLHIQYANVYSEEPLYELSINYTLLDDQTQTELEPLMEDYYVSLGATEEYDDQPLGYYGKIIREKNIDEVKKTLGIVDTQNQTELLDLFDKLLKSYQELFDLLISVFQDGTEVDEYFGKSYYPRLRHVNYGFSIDSDVIYLKDYRTEIPTIKQHDFVDILSKTIQFCCFSEDQLDFYRVY